MSNAVVHGKNFSPFYSEGGRCCDFTQAEIFRRKTRKRNMVSVLLEIAQIV